MAKTQQPRIILVAGIILVAVTMLVGVSVFIIMERQAEALLRKSLHSSLQNRVLQTEDEIRDALGRTTIIANHPRLIAMVQRANVSTNQSAARNEISKIIADPLPQSEFASIAVYGKDGQELARIGVFSEQPDLAVPLLKLPGDVQLMWDGQLLLRAVVEIKKERRVVGKVVMESSMPLTMGVINNVRLLGAIGELKLCAPAGLETMQCFPTVLKPKMYTRALRSADGVQVPMGRALEGGTGFVVSKDRRDNEVATAYAPIGNLGLGMVLDVDASELFAPAWKQLRYLIPFLIFMFFISLLLLRWRLTPLVDKLVRSEAEAVQLNASLIEADKVKDDFIENMNHELRTPLTSIVGYIDLANDDAAAGNFSGMASSLSIIQRNSLRLKILIENMMQLSKTGFEYAPLSIATVDVGNILGDLIKLMGPTAQDCKVGLSLQLDSPSADLIIDGDSNQLEQIFVNLISNAIKFTPHNGTVTVLASRTEGGFVEVKVSDTGIGIPSEEFHEIFKRFFRASTAIAASIPGIGIGLSLVHSMVRGHHGTITFDSTVGEGAVFTVTLPIQYKSSRQVGQSR